MGNIARWPLAQWREAYGLDVFVETGTWKGDGVLAALRAGFVAVFSIELHPEQAESARVRVDSHLSRGPGAWVILDGDSAVMVPKLLDILARPHGQEEPVLWWLDAHLPERYEGTGRGQRTPLLHELGAIVGHSRDHSRDVFVLDDMRLYERQSWDHGNFGGPLVEGGWDITAMLGITHTCTMHPMDEGYLVALPK